MSSIYNINLYYLKLVLHFFTALFIYFTIFPKYLFKYKYTYKDIEVYHNNTFNEELKPILEKAEKLTQQSTLYLPKYKHKIFILDNKIMFTFLTLKWGNIIAANNIFLEKILLAKSNVTNDLAISVNGKSKRKLSGTIAHEMTHTLLKKNQNLFNYFKIPKWINEGYCDYIANDSSLDHDKGLELLCNNSQNDTKSFKYFKYRLFITYLMDIKNESILDIINNKYDLISLENDVIKHYTN